jgi:hypothetical protein
MTSRGGGPSKPSKFLIQIIPPYFAENLGQFSTRIYPADQSDLNRLRDLTFQCESTELPGRTISTSDILIAGPTIKLPYTSTYNEITFTFYCTNDMYEKRIFDAWTNVICSRTDNTLGYREEYATTIGIFQYDEGGDKRPWPALTYGVKLIDAFPTSINQLNLSWTDDNIHRLSVTFAYTYYEPLGKITNLVPIPIVGDAINGALSSTIGRSFDSVRGTIVNSLSNSGLNGQFNGAFSGVSNFLGSFL